MALLPSCSDKSITFAESTSEYSISTLTETIAFKDEVSWRTGIDHSVEFLLSSCHDVNISLSKKDIPIVRGSIASADRKP